MTENQKQGKGRISDILGIRWGQASLFLGPRQEAQEEGVLNPEGSLRHL